MKKTLISLLFLTQISLAQNVVYNNGPVGGGSGVLAVKLDYQGRELDKMRLERNMAVREMNFRIDREKSRWSRTTWWVIGIVAGGAAGYLGSR